MSKQYWSSLSEEEKKHQLELVENLQLARDQREKADSEKNNLTYTQSYNLNREADLSYSDMSPLVAKWDEEIRRKYEMTSGATRTKDTAIVSHLNSFNFEPDIVALDKDNKIINDLGEATEDLIIQSLKIEKWTNKQIDAQREFISQGNVFVREVCTKTPIKIHSNWSWKAGHKISDYKPDQNPITKYEFKMERQLVLGKNVFLSSIRERDIQKQERVAVWEEMSMAKAKTIYWKWDRWEFVKDTKGKGCQSSIESILGQDKSSDWSSEDFWNLQKPDDQVGILHVYDWIEKTYMIMINGIMMLPIGFSLYEVSPSGLIPIGKGDCEVIPWSAYSKWIPANTLVDTKMYDLVWNSIAQKMAQSAKPTLANNTGHVISSDLLYSGRIVNWLRANGLLPVLPEESRTITNSDTAFVEMVRQIISEKSFDASFTGGQVDADTATEMLEQKKNTIMKLFSLLEWWKNLEEQLSRLRIANIYTKWTKPEEVPIFEDVKWIVDGIETVIGKETKTKKVYKKETIQTKFKESGKSGVREVRFFWPDDKVPESEDDIYALAKEEDNLSREYGKQTRISYINSERLSRLFDWFWVIDIRQAREDDSHLDLMVYIDAKSRVAWLFPGSLNKDYTLQKIAKIQNEDVEKAYNKDQPQGMADVGAAQQLPWMKNPVQSVADGIWANPEVWKLI